MSNLGRKALTRSFLFLLVLGLAIFIPAGTFHYWQGWVCLLVYSIGVFGTTLFMLKRSPELLERRMKVGPKAEQRKKQRVIQSIAGFFPLAIVIAPALTYRLHGAALKMPIVLVGDGLLVLGFWLAILVIRENKYASATIETAASQQVVSTGPYRLIRHPMYASAVISQAGMPLALGAYWPLIFTAGLTGLIVLRLLDEEIHLQSSLPGYSEYCQKVRYRLIPYIW